MKGNSVLTDTGNFDCVWGFSLDYLHGILLGVLRQLWEVLYSMLTSNEVKVVNDRLTNLKPSRQVHRLPTEPKGKKSWKAAEWEYWLLFYGLAVLNSVVKEEYLKSFASLVKTVATLLTDEIKETELLQCEIDILQFIEDCQYITSFSGYYSTKWATVGLFQFFI